LRVAPVGAASAGIFCAADAAKDRVSVGLGMTPRE
jgi:predicted flavoprotein YhiN